MQPLDKMLRAEDLRAYFAVVCGQYITEITEEVVI